MDINVTSRRKNGNVVEKHGSIPAGVIINDYVDVTHGFFNAKEPGLVNAVLDRLAKTLRAS